MKSLLRAKGRSNELLLIIGLVLTILICTIPFRQEVEVTNVEEYTSLDQHSIEIGFGGPRVTWIRVMCNRTAEIRFMHQTGVWTSTETVLLASVISATASYNFRSEHSTNIVEIISDGPIQVYIVYTYLVEMEINLIIRFLNMFDKYPSSSGWLFQN